MPKVNYGNDWGINYYYYEFAIVEFHHVVQSSWIRRQRNLHFVQSSFIAKPTEEIPTVESKMIIFFVGFFFTELLIDAAKHFHLSQRRAN